MTLEVTVGCYATSVKKADADEDNEKIEREREMGRDGIRMNSRGRGIEFDNL